METKSFQVNGTHISTDNYSIKISCEAQGELLKVIEDPSQRIQTDMAFTTGVLATVPHSILLHVFRLNTERLAFGLYIHFPQDERAIVNVMSPIVVWKEELRPSDDIRLDAALRRDVAASLYPSSQPVDCLLPGYEYFQFNGWNELIISLTFNFTVSKRTFPSLEESEETSMTNQSTAELLGYLDTKSLFQCPDLSDMIIKCSGEEFQVHRIILAGKSDVFAAMLRLPVKESKEGCVVVNDIDPIVFKELLRFIYTGLIEVTDEGRADMLMQLYKAADKYDVKDLIQYCEKRMINAVTVDNVMEMYDLTTSRPNSPLAKKARQVIAWNKATFAGNVENFKNFSSKYPELMFEMFHL